jgi:signal transduction histidine kinase
MSDISIQKQAEKQASALAIETEKLSILSTFLENSAHSFRTPLTVLTGSLYLLEHQPLLEHQKPRLAVMKKQVDHLANLLENMLLLLRMGERTGFEFEYLDLNGLVGNVVDEQRPLAKQQKVACTFHPDTSLPQVWGDRIYLAAAVSNLVINAFNYTLSGGEILVRTTKQDMTAEISVKDNGIGISSADLPHIFERFFRSNLAISARPHGTGLGLSIVKEIVTAHQGQIEVESELGKGSIFRIRLPIVSGFSRSDVGHSSKWDNEE